MSKTATKQTEKLEATAKLREWFPRGATVYTVLRSVSRSGMSRDIGIIFLFNSPDYGIQAMHPNHAVSVVLGMRLMRDAVRVGGCGMDMGLHVVYSLGQALYGDGYALKHCWL